MVRHMTTLQNIVLRADYRCRDLVGIFISDHRCRSSTVKLFTDSAIDVGEVAIVMGLED
jgi:hypothetical protein